MAFDSNPGTAKLANVLSRRMKSETSAPFCLDFGSIGPDFSLTTNTFPLPIPRKDYTLCRHVAGMAVTINGGEHGGHENGNGNHDHSILVPAVKPGDRVLVAWVGTEAVVIDVILMAEPGKAVKE